MTVWIVPYFCGHLWCFLHLVKSLFRTTVSFIVICVVFYQFKCSSLILDKRYYSPKRESQRAIYNYIHMFSNKVFPCYIVQTTFSHNILWNKTGQNANNKISFVLYFTKSVKLSVVTDYWQCEIFPSRALRSYLYTLQHFDNL